MNRIVQQYGPGQAWRTNGSHSVKTDYLTNTASDCIYYYMSGDALANDGYYDANTLYVTKTADEDNKVSYEFKDKLGRIVLQRQVDDEMKNYDTYYVYDDFGNLRWVLPPMFESAADMQEGCRDYGYYYRYDERNRKVEKKLPGAEPVCYVYDRADRLIFSQDGEQRVDASWTFYKYDAFGRMILTGIWKNSGKTQADLNSLFKSTLVTESYSATGAYNYTWNTLTNIPSSLGANSGNIAALNGGSSSSILQVNYYDNYLFKSNSPYFGANYDYATPYGFDNQRYGTDADDGKSKGLLTGTITGIFDNSGNPICTVFYYDNKGRVIQSIASNQVGGFEKEYTNYSFTGKPTRKQMIHTSDYLDTGITETYTYDYDHADRPTTTKYKIDDDLEFTLSTLAYDNLGRLANKNQSENAVTTTYSYNIRNWLTDINSGPFKETIYYDESYLYNTPQYNGNISAVSWKHLVGSDTKGYLYTYDGLNRLKKGQFLNGTTIDDDFNEEISLYDKNGNIQQMQRYARISPPPNVTGILVDDLTLNYKGNQIVNIADAVPAWVSTIGFVPPSANVGPLLPVDGNNPMIISYLPVTIDDPVLYNSNGAIMHNYYNGIEEIAYNVLNLPDNIRFMDGHNIQYSYDAAGEKRRVVYQTVESNANIPLGKTAFTLGGSDDESTLTTDYCAGGHIVYEDGALKRILNSEGYVEKQLSGMYKYFYFAKDHLGNNRAVFSAISTILGGLPSTFGGPSQEVNYYPFGMPYYPVYVTEGYNLEFQPYKFGGKEYDEMFGLNWYDQGARPFWGIIPITPTMDPLAEKNYSVSPYVQWGNNPVNLVDPNGEDLYLYYYMGDNYNNGKKDEKSNRMFWAAAITRATDIAKSLKEGDKAIIKPVSSTSDFKLTIEGDIADNKDAYGPTKEVGIWSHGAFDGPLRHDQNGNLDQLPVSDWGDIDFNWSSDGASIRFYGCQTGRENDQTGQSFNEVLSGYANFNNVDVWGQTRRSWPSPYTNERYVTDDIKNNIHGYPTYMVGSNPGITSFFSRWTGTTAFPMSIYRNGKFQGNRYQPGRQY